MTCIRVATHLDAEALARLATQLGYAAEAATIAHRLREIADADGSVVLVADPGDGRLSGFAHAVAQRFLMLDPFVDLVALVVDADARGAGIGAELLAAVEGWAHGQGIDSMRVRSNVIRERAHRFYLRKGYTENKRQVVFVKHL